MPQNIPEFEEKDHPIVQEIICRIGHAHPIPTKSTEPGVEITQGLSSIIDAIISEAIALNYDFIQTCQGIVIGAFRCDRAISLEAHKTLRLLIQQILHSVYAYRGDINNAIKGILAGVLISAKGHKLNPQVAMVISKENISHALDTMGIEFTNH